MALLAAQTQGVAAPQAAGAPGAASAATSAVAPTVLSPAAAAVSAAASSGLGPCADGNVSLQSEEALASAAQQGSQLDAFAWQAPHPPATGAIALLLQSLDEIDHSHSDQTTK